MRHAPLLAAALLAANLCALAPTAGLAADAAAAADSAQAAPRLLRLLTVEGVPTDTSVHAEFMRGFEAGLAARTLTVERAAGSGEWRAAGQVPNRFRLVSDPAAEHFWTVQLVVGAPPPYAVSRKIPKSKKTERRIDPDLRASRGMTLAILALSPEAIAAGVRAMPDHMAFAFPAGSAPAGVLRGVPGGFDFPWREAGRISAALALELLHHRSGDLPEAERCDLAPAVRAGTVR